MDCLVTGGAGFIGSNLVDALVGRGDSVTVIDNLSSGKRVNLDGALERGARLHEIDVRDSAAVSEVFATARAQIVFHMAAQIDVRLSVENPAADAQANILGTIAVLEAARTTGCRRVVNTSTGGGLYGDAELLPTPEDYPIRPLAPYGQAKYAAEGYCDLYTRLHGLSTISLRYGNVYGPRQDPHGEAGVVAIFTRRLLSGEKTRINGDGKQTRDFVYVGDVAEANALALTSEAVGSFNVGTGIETDVNSIFQTLRRLIGSNQPEEHGPPLPGEQRRSVVDARKIDKTLGWRPKTSLDAGLDATVRYFREASPAPQAAPARPA